MANINKNIIMQAGAAVANATNKAAGLTAATPEPGTIISAIQLVNGGRTIGPDALAHFTETVRNKLLSLLVTMEHIQDFNGYDHPWPAGGGKNKYGGGLNQYNTNNVTTDVMSLPAGTYTFSVDYNAIFNDIYVRSGSTVSSPVLAETYGDKKITFTLSEDYETVMIQLYKLDGVSVSDVTHPQLELGSTQTEWMPYSNICPITGRTGLNVYRTGKNLLKLVESEMVSTGWDRRFPISLSAGTYIISCQNQVGGSVKGVLVILSDENDQTDIATLTSGYAFGDSVFVGAAATITAEQAEKIKWIRFACRAAGTTFQEIASGNLQLEVGSTATAYEPYNGNTYAVDWTTQAGTVYGGSADIVTGDIKAAPYYASYNGETLVGPWVSSMDEYDPEGTPTTGAQVVDLGGTMTEYHITGQDITTLMGDNYIWSDSGDVTITE